MHTLSENTVDEGYKYTGITRALPNTKSLRVQRGRCLVATADIVSLMSSKAVLPGLCICSAISSIVVTSPNSLQNWDTIKSRLNPGIVPMTVIKCAANIPTH